MSKELLGIIYYIVILSFLKPEVALRETGSGVWTGSGLIICEFEKNNLIRMKNSSDLIISKLPSYFFQLPKVARHPILSDAAM